jgi:CxxC motif-containing protein (DUF1111 family)
MGLGLATRFMLDRAATALEPAIELHGGEGSASRERFRKLGEKEQGEPLEFPRSR